MLFFKMIFVLVHGLIVGRARLLLELLALHQQLAVLRRRVQRPHIQDRVFWIIVSRKDWRQALIIVKPETVIKWYRQGLKMYWRWKSRNRNCGRPKVDQEIRELIGRISQENQTQKPDISILVTIGHFYFGLTPLFFLVLLASENVRFFARSPERSLVKVCLAKWIR